MTSLPISKVAEGMKEYSDREILKGLKYRQHNVVLFITERYLNMITVMVEKMGGSSQDAEDIFQEALMSVINKIDKNKLVLTSRFSTYLYAVCKNLRLCQIYEQKRENEHMYVYLNEIYHAEPKAHITKEIRENIFRYYFKLLSEVCKNILELYTIKASVKQIDVELGNTEKYIRKRKYECKNRLAKLVMENMDRV